MATFAPCLLPPNSYKGMCLHLARSFAEQERMPLEPRRMVRMVGILFARPKTAFASSEIVPSLHYFHRRSGRHINFYCAGFRPEWDLSLLAEADALLGYSDAGFDDFRNDIEARSKWRYSGGTDLLLANARFDGTDANIDFSSMIAANLVKMKADGAIDSVESFFEKIFQYAETQPGRDPTWGFSDSLGKELVPSALKNLLISLLPEGLRTDSKKAFHFVVSDLSI